jgi:hypothetical protein
MAGLLAALAVLWPAAPAQGQALSVTVSRNPVAVGEQFQVTFSLNANGSGFTGPSFDDFIVLGGPNASTSIQIINGAMSQTQTYSYYLRAKAEGNFRIGPASITSNGRVFESPPFSITVVKGSPQAAQPREPEKNESGVGEEDVFLRVSADKSRVVRGEGLTATYRLYTRVSLVNYAVTKAPALNGFWTQDIQLPSQLNLTTEVVNGIQYHVGVLKKVVLYPQQSGQLTVDAMEGEVIARIQVKRRRNPQDPFDLFNDPFFSNPFGFGNVRDVKVKLRSNPLPVQVAELPGNAPASFQGSVGRFAFSGELDKTETRANEPVTLRLRVKGSGNLSLVDPPDPGFPPGVESYDPKVLENFSTTAAGTAGTKTFEYLLIPRHEGTYTIEPVAFTWFDLPTKKYKTESSPRFSLRVLKGQGEGAAAVAGGPARSEVQVLAQDIRFIKTGKVHFRHAGSRFYGSPGFWSLAASPILLFAGLLLFKRRREKDRADRQSVRRRRATSMARKRLAAARKLLDARRAPAFYDETARALWGYVGDKLSIAPADLSRDSAGRGLAGRQVSAPSVQRLMAVLDDCEMARFGSAADSVDPEKVYHEAVALLAALEGEIKS